MEKTGVMVLNSKEALGNVQLNIMGSQIPLSDKIQNLGITVDSKLKLDSQVLNTCKVSYYYLHLISKRKHLLTFDALKRSTESFV